MEALNRVISLAYNSCRAGTGEILNRTVLCSLYGHVVHMERGNFVSRGTWTQRGTPLTMTRYIFGIYIGIYT